jgi:hypothetical protein
MARQLKPNETRHKINPVSLANLKPWKPGQSGNTVKPKKGRGDLGNDLADALALDFAKHGMAAIAKLRRGNVKAYIDACIKLAPRESHVTISPYSDMTDAQIRERLASLLVDVAPAAARPPAKVIDAQAETIAADDDDIPD